MKRRLFFSMLAFALCVPSIASAGCGGDGGAAPKEKLSGATVLGDVSARDLIIDGWVNGTVRTDTVNIGPQAIFEGELQCDHFEIAKGAHIGVKFNMTFNDPLKFPLPP